MRYLYTLLALLMFAAPANAATLLYKITGDATFTFKLDSTRTPDASTADEADYYDNSGDFGSTNLADVYLFTDSALGGLVINDYYGGVILLDAQGPALFTGPTSAPQLSTGNFTLNQNPGLGNGVYQLSVSTVPEPFDWALLIGGFAVAGTMARTQSKRASQQTRAPLGPRHQTISPN